MLKQIVENKWINTAKKLWAEEKDWEKRWDSPGPFPAPLLDTTGRLQSHWSSRGPGWSVQLWIQTRLRKLLNSAFSVSVALFRVEEIDVNNYFSMVNKGREQLLLYGK